MKKWYYSIDIGGTNVKFGKIDEKGQLLQTWKIETKANDANDFYNRLAAQISDSAKGIGVCAPGIFDEDGMILTKSSGNASCLYLTNPIKELEKRLSVPVTLINDAKACGLCELKLGAAKHKTRSACYVIGTGIGGCLMDENGIHMGANGFSGEFSYMPIYSEHGIKQLGNEASMTALLNNYQAIHPEVCDTYEIMRRYHNQEEDAKKVISHWINAIAMQCITIHCVYRSEERRVGKE